MWFTMNILKMILLADDQYDKITESELAAAAQVAIWCYSDSDCFESEEAKADFRAYTKNYDTDVVLGAEVNMYHNLREEEWNLYGGRGGIAVAEVGDRITAIADWLYNLEPVYREDVSNHTVINTITLADITPIINNDEDVCAVELKIKLIGSCGENDNISITAESSADSETIPVQAGVAEYELLLNAKAGEKISVVMEGTQEATRGVYFYEAKI